MQILLLIKVNEPSVKTDAEIMEEATTQVLPADQQIPEDRLVAQEHIFDSATPAASEEVSTEDTASDTQKQESSDTAVTSELGTETVETALITTHADGTTTQTVVTADPAGTTSASEVTEVKPQLAKRLDMESPIPLTSETVVVIDGKKCVLRVDPESNHLVAYPFTPTPVPGR